jgi:hypothetical protein
MSLVRSTASARFDLRWTALLVVAACGGRPANNVEHCGEVDRDEVWVEGTHLVSCDVLIRGAHVEVEAGAELIFTVGTSLDVDEDGSFAAAGDESGEVLLRGDLDSPGSWEGLFFRAGADGAQSSLHGARIRNAGQSNGTDRAAALTVYGAQLEAVGLTLEDNAGLGFVLRDGAGFQPGSSGLVVTGNGAAGEVEGAGVGTLPPDAALTGNIVDTVEVYGSVDVSATWPALAGAPYVVTADIVVGGEATPLLTLAAGAELRFDGAALTVGADDPGALWAVGTVDAPIVFTALSPTPGAWDGIALEANTNGGLTRVQHVDVGFGGAYFGAIYVADGSPTIDTAYLHDSAGCGLFLAPTATPTLGGITYDDNAGGDLCD